MSSYGYPPSVPSRAAEGSSPTTPQQPVGNGTVLTLDAMEVMSVIPEGLRRCEQCGSQRWRPIVYGYPDDKMFSAAEREEIELGGCVIEDSAPSQRCVDCGQADTTSVGHWGP